jgi:hypothetical protein
MGFPARRAIRQSGFSRIAKEQKSAFDIPSANIRAEFPQKISQREGNEHEHALPGRERPTCIYID